MKTFSKKEIWFMVSLIILGGFIYAFNLHNKLFWDDEDWIINNLFVHSLSWINFKFWFTHNTLAGIGLKSNYYRPFLFFTFAFNYAVAGVKPLFYHFTNNVIHIFNTLLIFWLIRAAFLRFDLGSRTIPSHRFQRATGQVAGELRDRSAKRSNLMAFLTALFFLIHPLQTEAVTYISGRGDVLVAMFMLLALILFYKSEQQDGTVKRFRPVVLKILSVVSLILGLLSRETGIVFPLLALVFYMAVLDSRFDLLKSQGRTFWSSLKHGLIKTWPYFGAVVVYGILRLTALNFLNTLNFYTEPNVYSEHLSVRFFTFLPILGQYLKLLLVPVGLHMERGATVYTSFFQWPVWFIGLVLIGLLVWLRHLYRSRAIQGEALNVENFKVWFLGVAWFFIALAPVSGITPINALMYEHWLYLPMVGFWLIVSYYLVKGFDYLKVHRQIFPLVFGGFLFLVYVLFFGYQSIQRNIVWGRPAEFYQDILQYEPKSSRISNNLGNLYYNQGDQAKSEFYYRQAVESNDAFPQPYFNLGTILQSKGDLFGAVKLYEKAIEINPNFYYPYQNLAVIYAQQGKLDKARDNLEKLKLLLPNNPRVFYNSALVYLAINDKKQAWLDLQEGSKYISSDPPTGKLIQELLVKLASSKKQK